MIQHIYAVFDVKAKAYLPPFFLPEEGMAIRTFTNCCQDDNHQFGRNPEDFTLFSLGDFNDENGEITVEGPFAIINGLVATGSMNHHFEMDEMIKAHNAVANGKERIEQ